MAEQQSADGAATGAAATAASDAGLRKFREYVAAAIALVIVGGMVALVGASFLYVGVAEDPAWSRFKDLLLLVNPLVGVVVGYYFNKVSTEARAESAEQTAKSAATAAQRADVARDAAQAEASRAQSRAQEATAALTEVAGAAERLVTSDASGAGVLGESHGSPDGARDGARAELMAALARARRFTG